jgi:hypothetical protein
MPCLDCDGENPDWIQQEDDYRIDQDLITPFPFQAVVKEVHDGFSGPFAPDLPAIAPDDVEG